MTSMSERDHKKSSAGCLALAFDQPYGSLSSHLQARNLAATAAMHDPVLNRMGSSAGLMAQVGATSPAEDIPQGDLDTAKVYGERLAAVAAKLRA